MYADNITGSMRAAISETNRRRKIQKEYNDAHGIVPQTVKKDVRDIIELAVKDKDKDKGKARKMSKAELDRTVAELTEQMKAAAATLNFELAAALRDKIAGLKRSKK